MADSYYQEVLEDCETAIEAIGLTGIADASIVIRRLPWDDDLTLPAIVLSPGPERLPSADTGRDHVNYRVLVGIGQASNLALTDNTGLWAELKWREQIRDTFHNKQPFTFTLSNAILQRTTVEPLDVVAARAFRLMYDAQFLIINCLVYERR